MTVPLRVAIYARVSTTEQSPEAQLAALRNYAVMGRLFFNIIGSFAEFEREMIIERVRAGLVHARAKGQMLGRPERDPTAKARIVALRAEGLSLRAIARREGRSPSGVLKILRMAAAGDSEAGRP